MSDQSEGSAVYNILAFAFEGQHTAKKIVKDIKSSGALKGYDIIAQAVVEKTDKGKVKVHEPGRGGVGAAVGAAGGGLLALIGGPVGVLAWAAAASWNTGAPRHPDETRSAVVRRKLDFSAKKRFYYQKNGKGGEQEQVIN